MSGYTRQSFNGEHDDKLTQYPPLLRRLLLLRGVTEEKDAELFLNPNWERDTHNPFLMKDMKRSVERVYHAIENNERIAIWSDYDMDGIPGAVVLYDFFTKIGFDNLVHYTPHRNKEGFGLNIDGLQKLVDDDVKLVITVDCGITNVDEVVYANKENMNVIITDHHIPGSVVPEAYAILNPKQETCEYPEKMLAGAGVAFKFVQGLIAELGTLADVKQPAEGWEKWLLDMVGMATIADMVPLRGENRMLAHYGLMVLRKSRRLGLHALLRKARANQAKLVEDDVAFTIAPRVNAASRMGHASTAFSLFTATSPEDAGALAQELDSINTKRKTIVATMKRETKRRLEKRDALKSVIVMGNPEWKPSLLGLVASGVADEYERPVFLWGKEGGDIIKGSCRSDGVANVYELMHAVKECFIEYGGHAFSGGFSLEADSVHALEAVLDAAYETHRDALTPKNKCYDEVLDIERVTWDTYREVARLAPFGEGNPKPLFYFKNVQVQSVRMFGKGSEHLELTLERASDAPVKVIEFFTKRTAEEFSARGTFSFVAHLEASHFMGRTELRLRLVEVL